MTYNQYELFCIFLHKIRGNIYSAPEKKFSLLVEVNFIHVNTQWMPKNIPNLWPLCIQLCGNWSY